MTLHLLLSSDPATAQRAIQWLANGDALLLASDGVYLATHAMMGGPLPANCQCFIRQQDAATRGISVPEHIHAVDDARWVDLTLQSHNTLSWI